MSEENKIYCTQCGSGNDASSRFCRNCGAKLEQAGGQSAQTEGVFSREETKPVYERITDAEEEKPKTSPYQEEIHINYGSGQSGYSSSTGNSYYDAQTTQYYSAEQNETKQGGGNIGFAIASLICGIVSLVCCCLGLFSAVLGIAAIVLGIITLCFKYDGKGMAIAGIITGGFALVFVIFAMIMSGTTAYRELVDELADEFY